MTHTLGSNLDLSTAVLNIGTPMLLKNYVDASKKNAGTADATMVAGAATDRYVRIYHGTTSYYASKVVNTESSGANTLVADFTISSSTIINSGEQIEIHIPAMTNPPSVAPLTGITLTIKRGAVSEVLTLTSGLVTCANESTEASANAVLGYDRVGTHPAQYRFRFRTTVEMPTTAGFQIIMPSGYWFTVTADYKLTCHAGCTATALAPATAKDDTNSILTFDDVFTAHIPVDTVVDLVIEGW